MAFGGKRSTLIYGQHEIKKKSRKVDLQNIVYLRSFLRRGIIVACHLGLEKEKFLSMLNGSKMQASMEQSIVYRMRIGSFSTINQWSLDMQG
jgi:hypothetical protein